MAKKTKQQENKNEKVTDIPQAHYTTQENQESKDKSQDSGKDGRSSVSDKNPSPEKETPASEENTQEKKDVAEENASQGDGSNENQDSGTKNQDTEVESLVVIAAKIKQQRNVKEVYRTKDGLWFTKKEYADQHKKKVGGSIDIY